MVAEGKTGELRLAYMPFAAALQMPRLVARYRTLYPGIALTLIYIRTQGQKLGLANDEVDLEFMIGPFDHSDFHTLLVADESLYLVTWRNHPPVRPSKVTPHDLAQYDIILNDMTEWDIYRWCLGDMFSSEGLTIRVGLEASNSMALLGLVAAGLGVTIYILKAWPDLPGTTFHPGPLMIRASSWKPFSPGDAQPLPMLSARLSRWRAKGFRGNPNRTLPDDNITMLVGALFGSAVPIPNT